MPMKISFTEALKKMGTPISTSADPNSAQPYPMPELSAVNPQFNKIDPAKVDDTSKVSVVEAPPKVKPVSEGTLNPSSWEEVDYVNDAVEAIQQMMYNKGWAKGMSQADAYDIRDIIVEVAVKAFNQGSGSPKSIGEAAGDVINGVGEMIATHLRKHPRIGKGAEIKVVENANDKKAKIVVDARPKGGTGVWDIEETNPNAEKFVVTFKRFDPKSGSKDPIFSASETATGTNAVIKSIMKWARPAKGQA